MGNAAPLKYVCYLDGIRQRCSFTEIYISYGLPGISKKGNGNPIDFYITHHRTKVTQNKIR